MNISQHLDKNNLHHAYLIEGLREGIVPEILSFCESMDIKTSGNSDFYHITIDNFKIDEAFDLRAMSSEKSFSSEKKIFLLCANNISLDAQNVLLKMFEEPIENTHFFLIIPDINALLKTLVSRFYLIKNRGQDIFGGEAEKFINMSLQKRIDYINELLPKKDKENEGDEDITKDSNRTKALDFLNALEVTLHNKFMSKTVFDSDIFIFNHFFKVREFLRMPGSSAKNLMESVALVIPKFLN